MTHQPFTLEPDRYYAWQLLPGHTEAPYYSPIRVHAVTPLEQDDGTFELSFENCFHAGGVQDMAKQLRTLHRAPRYLVAVELPEESGRTVILSELTEGWAHMHCGGEARAFLAANLDGPAKPLALDCIVEDDVYLGPFPHDRHVSYLQELGIQAVLSIVDDHDPHRVGDRIRSEFAWAQIPVRDSYLGGVPTVADLADAVAVLRAWKAQGLRRFYVHCLAGQGRSPLVTMAYLVHGQDGADKLRLTKAIAQVSNRRPEADPNVAQLRVLTDYVEKALNDPRYAPEHYEPSPRVLYHRPAASPSGVLPTEEGCDFETLRDRFRGAMMGLAVGDALGAAVEFMPPGTFEPVSELTGGGQFDLKPGEWTDDTSMALCLAESLVTRQGFDAVDQLERYLAWWRDGHLSSRDSCFDIGITIRQVLGAFEERRTADVGATHEHSAGNGSLMRLAPVPLFYYQDPAAALERAADSSRTTHAHPAAVDACRYHAGLIVGALRGASKEELLSPLFTPVPGYFEHEPLEPAIMAIAAGSFKEKQPPEIQGKGYVVQSLEAALWAFYHGQDFEEGCKLAVNLGWDADTTGAIYGQLAGAYYGESAIPARWRNTLVQSHRIGWFAEALLLSALRGASDPEPPRP